MSTCVNDKNDVEDNSDMDIDTDHSKAHIMNEVPAAKTACGVIVFIASNSLPLSPPTRPSISINFGKLSIAINFVGLCFCRQGRFISAATLSKKW